MSEKKNRIFLGQLTERKGPYGTFHSGRIGAAQMVMSPAKETGKVNVYMEEMIRQEDAKPKQDKFSHSEDLEEMPF